MGPDLTKRDRQPEIMDDPTLDADRHRTALNGLRRINRFSRSAAILWPAIRDTALQTNPSENQPLRILDIATGGGDVALTLAARARQKRLEVAIHGCDISPVAVEYASELARRSRLNNLRFTCEDALRDSLDGPYDIVMCSLFLHHLTEDDARALLRRMKELAVQRVLVNDLRRSQAGYALAWLGCRLLSRSPVVRTDGPLSVQGAFSIEEARELAESSGLTGATITKHWPQRFLLNWKAA